MSPFQHLPDASLDIFGVLSVLRKRSEVSRAEEASISTRFRRGAVDCATSASFAVGEGYALREPLLEFLWQLAGAAALPPGKHHWNIEVDSAP